MSFKCTASDLCRISGIGDRDVSRFSLRLPTPCGGQKSALDILLTERFHARYKVSEPLFHLPIQLSALSHFQPKRFLNLNVAASKPSTANPIIQRIPQRNS